MEILKKKMLTHASTPSRASRDTFGFFLLLRKTQSNPPETPKLQEEPQKKNVNQLKLKGTRLEVKASPRRGLVGGWEHADRHWQHSSR